MNNKTIPICYLNGKEYKISKNMILRYINNSDFTTEEKEKIADNVILRMTFLKINGPDCQEFNFIEDRYTDACMSYIFDHDSKVESLLNENDDNAVWKYLR